MLVELETFEWSTNGSSSSYNKYIDCTRTIVINTDMIICIEPRHDLMYKNYSDVFKSDASLENVDYYEIKLCYGKEYFRFYIKSDVYKKFKELYIENPFKESNVL